MSSSKKVVVVGGGLAGITAALRCADAGCQVTLLEARPRLGGLTHSFQRGPLTVDNGQHVFLRCCTAYLGLLDRLGVAERVTLQRRLRVPVLSPSAPPAVLTRGPLPPPAHLAVSLLTYRHLSTGERVRAARTALALRRVDVADPAADRRTFGDWLAQHGETRRSVTAMWDLFGVAALNAPAAEASLSLAATVFQTGLLRQPDAGDIGWATIPLQELHGTAAAAAMADAGVAVMTATRVDTISPHGSRWQVGAGGTQWQADGVVLATPAAVAERLAPEGAFGQPAGWAQRLGAAPIVNVHVWFDRRVLDEPFVAGIDTDAQWVFDRTEQSGAPHGQYLAISVSAADDLVDVPAAELRGTMLPQLEALLPRARCAQVLDYFVTRERQATFRPSPGTAALRPDVATRADGLFVAGAWTATGWPATMEGAVRSGSAAASGVLATTGSVPCPEKVVA